MATPERARPIASNSSMKPTAPPFLRAALRSARKNWRTLRWVAPWKLDWNDVAGGEQERHAGLRRKGLRRVGLAGARAAFEQQAAARRAAHLLAKVLCARNRFSERTTSSLTGSMPTTSSKAGRRSARGRKIDVRRAARAPGARRRAATISERGRTAMGSRARRSVDVWQSEEIEGPAIGQPVAEVTPSGGRARVPSRRRRRSRAARGPRDVMATTRSDHVARDVAVEVGHGPSPVQHVPRS